MDARPNNKAIEQHTREGVDNATPRLFGAILGEYRVLDYLGEGAIGVVYRAERPRDGQQVAIKVLKPSVARHPDMVARFLQQARVIGGATHPNIVEIQQVVADAERGLVYVVMELLRGQSLADIIATRGPLATAQAVSIGMQIADALSTLHGQGILYRDLKPGNIFVAKTADGNHLIKLVDFDLVETIGEGAKVAVSFTGGPVGTPAYMAPEHVLGRALDVRADVYALGVVLYQMFSGSLPFDADDLADVLIAQVREAPMPLRLRCAQKGVLVPVELEALVMRCLEKPRVRRFQQIREVREALEQGGIAASEPLRKVGWADQDPLARSIATDQRRLSWAVWIARAAGVGLLVLVIALVWFANVTRTAVRRTEPSPGARAPSVVNTRGKAFQTPPPVILDRGPSKRFKAGSVPWDNGRRAQP